MPTITLTFPFDVNFSCQSNPAATVGNHQGADIAYYVPTGVNGGFDINSSTIVYIGPVIAVDPNGMWIQCDTNSLPPPAGAFIFFSKDNKANLSSLLGYYAHCEIRNNSTEQAEMFRIGVDYHESSK